MEKIELVNLEFSFYDIEERTEHRLCWTELKGFYLPKQVISEIENKDVPSFAIRGIRGEEVIPEVVYEAGVIRINIPIHGPLYAEENDTEIFCIFSFLRRIVLDLNEEEKNPETDITYQYQLALINLKLAEILAREIMKKYEHKEEKE